MVPTTIRRTPCTSCFGSSWGRSLARASSSPSALTRPSLWQPERPRGTPTVAAPEPADVVGAALAAVIDDRTSGRVPLREVAGHVAGDEPPAEGADERDDHEASKVSGCGDGTDLLRLVVRVELLEGGDARVQRFLPQAVAASWGARGASRSRGEPAPGSDSRASLQVPDRPVRSEALVLMKPTLRFASRNRRASLLPRSLAAVDHYPAATWIRPKAPLKAAKVSIAMGHEELRMARMAGTGGGQLGCVRYEGGTRSRR